MTSWRSTLLFLLVATATAMARPARVILLRHAEKPPLEISVHLSERGQTRAQALVNLLSVGPVLGTNGPPAALFAPEFTKRGHGSRPYETLLPLGHVLKLPVQTPYHSKAYAALAKHILKDSALEGKTVVVCWVHDYLPDLARALGLKPKPPPWKGSVYDRVWVITYDQHRARLTDLPQKLLPGDSAE